MSARQTSATLALGSRLRWPSGATARRFPFAVCRASDKAVIGSTSYWDFDAENRGLEIGSTWLSRAQWRTGANLEAKLLLMSYAFESLGLERVGFRTDIRNERSQRAIEGLGAIRDGVHRHEKLRRDGSWRDSIHYSNTRSEWPSAKQRITERLTALASRDAREGLGRQQDRVVSSGERQERPAAADPPIDGVTLRAATVDDIDGVIAFWRVAATNTDRPIDCREAVGTLISQHPDALLLAVDEHGILGCVITGWDGWRAHLYRLAVHPDRRRRGLAHCLVMVAEQRLRARGAIRIDAMVLDDNDSARGLRSAAGYTRQQTWSRWVSRSSSVHSSATQAGRSPPTRRPFRHSAAMSATTHSATTHVGRGLVLVIPSGHAGAIATRSPCAGGCGLHPQRTALSSSPSSAMDVRTYVVGRHPEGDDALRLRPAGMVNA